MNETRLISQLAWRGKRDIAKLVDELLQETNGELLVKTLVAILAVNFNPPETLPETVAVTEVPERDANLTLMRFLAGVAGMLYNPAARKDGVNRGYSQCMQQVGSEAAKVVHKALTGRLNINEVSLSAIVDVEFDMPQLAEMMGRTTAITAEEYSALPDVIKHEKQEAAKALREAKKAERAAKKAEQSKNVAEPPKHSKKKQAK